MRRELTERQSEVAIALREVAKTPNSEAWGAFTDFISSVAQIVEGVESLINPFEMQKRFAGAWEACAKIWMDENYRIVRDCLGSDAEFERVRNHPNGRTAIGRILNRVREVHGELTPGMVINVEVGDILVEELGETT